MITKNSKIFIAGANGFVGSSITNELLKRGYTNIIAPSSKDLDLTNQQQTNNFFASKKPEYVIDAAAKVGGIMANIDSPAEFLYRNLAIETNIIHASYINDVKKLIFLSSSCIYPRNSEQPMKESYVLDGKLEPTNEGYAIAKIAGMKLCEMYNKQYGTQFISLIPCNLFGTGDNFHPKNSHVIAGLITKFHTAKKKKSPSITLWGTGNAKREFLYIDDFSKACVFILESYTHNEPLNVGSGKDISIAELAELVKSVIGYNGEVLFDSTKPDGMPRKLMNVDKINTLGWNATTPLREGIKFTYDWYLNNIL